MKKDVRTLEAYPGRANKAYGSRRFTTTPVRDCPVAGILQSTLSSNAGKRRKGREARANSERKALRLRHVAVRQDGAMRRARAVGQGACRGFRLRGIRYLPLGRRTKVTAQSVRRDPVTPAYGRPSVAFPRGVPGRWPLRSGTGHPGIRPPARPSSARLATRWRCGMSVVQPDPITRGDSSRAR